MTIAPALPLVGEPTEVASSTPTPTSAAPAPAPTARGAAPQTSAEDAACTLSVLAILLANPADPLAAGAAAPPVRAALAGPLGRLLATEEQGWRLDGPARSLRRPPAGSAGPALGRVAAPVAAALEETAAGPDGQRGGWRLPERG